MIGNNFIVPTTFNADISSEYKMPFSLPAGSHFRKINYL